MHKSIIKNKSKSISIIKYHVFKTYLIHLLLLISTLFIFSINSCQDSDSHLIVAKVGDKTILQSDFIERYEEYLLQTGIKDNFLSRKEVLNSMISEVLLLNFDNNQKIYENTIYKKELEWLEKQVVLAYLKDREVYAKINITDMDMRKAFLRSNQKIAARHLFAKTEEEAKNISELLKIGVDFNTLAKQSFTDSTLKNNGGYLGYFSWGDMEPEFEDKAFSMKIGEISDPIKTKNGYSIIKLEDRVTHPLLTEHEFQRKKGKFEQILRIRNKIPSEKKYINAVVDFSRIEFNDEMVDKIWDSIKLKLIQKDEIIDIIPSSRIVVSYNGVDYSVENIIEKLNQIPSYHFDKIISVETLKTVIKGIILQEKLLNIAFEKDYDENKYVLEKTSKMKTNLFMKFKISEIIENYKIDDSVIFNFYNSHQDFFSTHNQVNVQEILVEDLDLAKSLVKKIKNGADFGNLAKINSIRKSTAENNGIIGLAKLSKYGSLKNLFSNSEINEIIGPIEINDIFGIFRVLDRTESEVIPFEEAKEVASMAVKFKLKNNIVKNYVDQLMTKIGVQIIDKNLGSAKIFQLN